METLNSLKSFVGMNQEPPPPPTFMEQVEQQFNCSYTNRLIGFGVCLISGLILCIIVRYHQFNPKKYQQTT